MPRTPVAQAIRAGLAALALSVVVLHAGCSGDACAPDRWTPLLDEARLGRPVLAAWGRADDLWLVGGPVGASGPGALVLHHDASGWKELATGRAETLWWVWGTDDGDEVWLVGERGLVLRWRGGVFETLDAGVTTATLYGVWGSGPGDVWLVGGTPGGGTRVENDVVRHFDGARFDDAAGPPATGAAFFKIWGAGAEAWIVGEGGTAWRRTAAGWEDHKAELATRDSVTTVHGCSAGEVYAVAGMTIYAWRGAGWQKAGGASPLAAVNGVACGATDVLAVGNGGLKLRYDRALGRWLDETLEEPLYADFHGALVLGPHQLVAVGGNYNAPAASGRVGMAGFRGCPAPR